MKTNNSKLSKGDNLGYFFSLIKGDILLFLVVDLQLIFIIIFLELIAFTKETLHFPTGDGELPLEDEEGDQRPGGKEEPTRRRRDLHAQPLCEL